jgi:hypothetical protein
MSGPQVNPATSAKPNAPSIVIWPGLEWVDGELDYGAGGSQWGRRLHADIRICAGDNRTKA